MRPDTANTPFDSPVRGLRETGASSGDRDLVELLTRHGLEEADRLARYEELARSASPSLRYLVELIVEDERRHHRFLAEIADAIAWGTVDDQALGVPRPDRRKTDAAVVAETKALLAAERRDRTELRRLHRRLRAYTGTLWPLLIELMLRDTDKHVRILKHVAKHGTR